MGHSGWLLWVLVPLGAALAKGAPVPKFSWNNTYCHLAVPGTAPTFPLKSLQFLSWGPHGLAFFDASWDGQGHLLECTHSEEAAIVLPYQASCVQEMGRENSSGVFAHTLSPSLLQALGALQEQQNACGRSEQLPRPGKKDIWGQWLKGQAGREEGAQEVTGHRRIKRGWTMPGTLWCGVGDTAGNSTELGVFKGPDLCCREHDLCAHSIAPFKFNYGIRNYRFHTISHCDCDARFQACLRRQEDPISDFVGTTFFNLLEIPCFVLEEKEECVEWYWWGGCKKFGPIVWARLLQQSPYNGTQTHPRGGRKPARKKLLRNMHRGQRMGYKTHFHPSSPQPSSLQKTNTSTHPPSPTLPGLTPSSVPPEAGTSPGKQARVTSDSWAKGNPRDKGHRTGEEQAAGSPTEGAAEGLPETPPPEGAGPKPTPHPTNKKKIYQAFSKDCRCYRRLDQCEHRIEPQETKYHLYNSDSHTLFHCNCTRRLARKLRTKSPNEVDDKLGSLLAMTCFELAPPEDCEASNGCGGDSRAVVVPARHLRRLWKKRAGLQSGIPGKALEERRKKGKRERSLRSQGRRQEHRGAMTLYDECLQMISAAQQAPQ